MLDIYENEKKQIVIVLNEAHHFSDSMLLELRFILNFKKLHVSIIPDCGRPAQLPQSIESKAFWGDWPADPDAMPVLCFFLLASLKKG